MQIFSNLSDKILYYVDAYAMSIFSALVLLVSGVLVAFLTYYVVIFLFKKFKIIELVDRFTKPKTLEINDAEEKVATIAQKIEIDRVVAKGLAYYVFLVFFRFAVSALGIDDIEEFLDNLLVYLPNLFIGLLIGFFGLRFSNFVYNVVHGAVSLKSKKTASILATGAKIIILFFTLMAVLSHIGISPIIVNTILIGFVSMLALAGGLAFGLGGKDVAKEILESFRK